jgi:Xaa-Pro dipeptidase
VHHNLSLIRPGVSFREFSERSWRAPEEYAAQTVGSVIHGVGFGVDYPQISRSPAYDGVFEEGMTVCVESYIGAVGGPEGVKLEEQVLVTTTGAERLSTFPLEEDLLS